MAGQIARHQTNLAHMLKPETYMEQKEQEVAVIEKRNITEQDDIELANDSVHLP